MAKISEQRALRARLVDEELPRLASVITRLTKRLAAIDDDEFYVTGDIEVTEERGLPPISGGSDADIPEGEVPTGCATDMAPHAPQRSGPGNPGCPSTLRALIRRGPRRRGRAAAGPPAAPR